MHTCGSEVVQTQHRICKQWSSNSRLSWLLTQLKMTEDGSLSVFNDSEPWSPQTTVFIENIEQNRTTEPWHGQVRRAPGEKMLYQAPGTCFWCSGYVIFKCECRREVQIEIKHRGTSQWSSGWETAFQGRGRSCGATKPVGHNYSAYRPQWRPSTANK